MHIRTLITENAAEAGVTQVGLGIAFASEQPEENGLNRIVMFFFRISFATFPLNCSLISGVLHLHYMAII